MTNLNSRLAQLEKQSAGQPWAAPEIVELYGEREGGRVLLVRRVNGVLVFPTYQGNPAAERINELIDLAHARKAESEKL